MGGLGGSEGLALAQRVAAQRQDLWRAEPHSESRSVPVVLSPLGDSSPRPTRQLGLWLIRQSAAASALIVSAGPGWLQSKWLRDAGALVNAENVGLGGKARDGSGPSLQTPGCLAPAVQRSIAACAPAASPSCLRSLASVVNPAASTIRSLLNRPVRICSASLLLLGL